MQTVQLHKSPFQFLIKILNWFRFSDVLIWKERLFRTFGLYTFKLFAPKVTWFHSEVSRFNLYCSLTNLYSLWPQRYCSKTLDLAYLLFYIFQYTNFLNHLHSFLLFLFFLINLHKVLSNHCIKIEALFQFQDFQFCSGI